MKKELKNNFDIDYRNILIDILDNGEVFNSRGTKSRYLFAKEFKIDFKQGFPITTLRKIGFKSTLKELLWDVSGSSKISNLQNNTFEKVWNQYNNGYGYVNHSYSRYWRFYPGTRIQGLTLGSIPGEEFRYSCIDQLEKSQKLLKEDPTTRQNIIFSASPTEIKLKNDLGFNCHPLICFNSNGEYCDLHVYGRSWDAIVGLPGDCIRYGLLLQSMSEFASLKPRFLHFSTTNLHVYEQHLNYIDTLIDRQPFKLPTLKINNSKIKKIWQLTVDDFNLMNYNSNKAIKIKFIK